MEATAFVTVLPDRLGAEDAPQASLAAGAVHQRMLGDIDPWRGEDLASLHYDMTELRRDLREELEKLRADLHRDRAESSADAMRWALLFWIAQAVAVAGIVSALR